MTQSIAGKTAIVTGAANGVGLAIARRFLEAGANVMFADRDEERLIDELGGNDGEEAETSRYFAGDLRERLCLTNLLAATIDAFDRVDILINAARQVLPSDPLDIDDGSVEAMLQQNLIAALRLSQIVAKRMIAQAKGATDEDEVKPASIGSIVNLTSIAGRRTRPGLLAYSISAAASDQMTRSLAVSLAPRRIRVNSVAFGSVMSAVLHETLKGNEALRDDIIAHTPLGRIAEAEEVAAAVQYLCSDDAGFVTGQILTVDGGRTLLDPVTAPTY